MKRFLVVLFAILAFAMIVSCDTEVSVSDEPSSEFIIETEIVDGLKTESYKDSVSGIVVKIIYYKADGSKERAYEYDPSTGNMIKDTHYEADGSIRFENEYDPSTGEITKYTYCIEGEGIRHWQVIEYDPSTGNEIKYSSYNADGTIISWGEYENDPLTGKRIKVTNYNSDGTIISLGEYEHDPTTGKINKLINYDAKGNKKSEYLYDPSTGYRVKIINYDAEGNKSGESECDPTTGKVINTKTFSIIPRYFSYNPETGTSYSGEDTFSREFKYYYTGSINLICYPHSIYMAYILGGGTGKDSLDNAGHEAFYWYLETYFGLTKADIISHIEDGDMESWTAQLTASMVEPSSGDVPQGSGTIVYPQIDSKYSDETELTLRYVFFYKEGQLVLEDGNPVPDNEKAYIVTEDWQDGRHVCWIFLPYSYLLEYESSFGKWNGTHHIFRDYLVKIGILEASQKNNYNYLFPVSLLKEVFGSI